jgi:hypothetical protein
MFSCKIVNLAFHDDDEEKQGLAFIAVKQYLMKTYFPGPVFLVSRYGRPVIQMGLHRYNKRDNRSGRTAKWVCVKRRSYDCKAEIVTFDNYIVLHDSAHTHY